MNCICCSRQERLAGLLFCQQCIDALTAAEGKLPCRREKLKSSSAKKILTARYQGKIIHITNSKGFLGIVSSGGIEPNISEKFINNYGAKISFFRNIGCISLCDFYNNKPSRNFDEAIDTFRFYDLYCNKGVSYFLSIKKELFSNIITWEKWKNNITSGDVVPHFESGYCGNIKIHDIEFVDKIFIKDHFDQEDWDCKIKNRQNQD